MCPWQTSSPPTPPSPEWQASTPWWWFNIISEHDWLWALETQHYTTPCRVLMFWKTRYHLFPCHPSLTNPVEKRSGNLAGEEKMVVMSVFYKCSGACMCVCTKLEKHRRLKTNPCFVVKVIHRWIQSTASSSRRMFPLRPYFAILSSIFLNHNTSHTGGLP